ncbi:MAG TPA: exopolysaccharide biosynthesis protein, partial [Halieaceae bacterium]|nr:exopolysaccharide biosynthesis protein [Halieaceae bacterium]
MSTIEKALSQMEAAKQAQPEPPQKTVERAGEAQQPPPALTSSDSEDTSDWQQGAQVHIPFDALHAQGFLTPAIPRSAIAEEFRTIKRPLLKNASGNSASPIANANLIMVTSALQGDGKTFSSINLALSIAMERDKTVLFVDADVLKATAGHRLGIPAGTPGLIDVLRREAKPEDVILRTNMEKLRILPAGTADEHATELLASENMHQFMLELSARYPDRIIVFDSPPLLLTTEAGV